VRVGTELGAFEGIDEGDPDGLTIGPMEGFDDGINVGTIDTVGVPDGAPVGVSVGE
jgi:hypothetical protein